MDHCMYLIGDGWVGSDPCDLGMASDWLSRILSEQSEVLRTSDSEAK